MAKKNNNEKLKIIPLERSERMIETMKKMKIDLGLSPRQALQIIQSTNSKFVRERVVARTKSGKEIKAKYVPGRFFELKLISVFGWNWKTEIVKSEIRERKDGKREFIKTIRLWFKLPNNEWNYIERTGGAVSKEGIDDFNREKAAETDSFKRCCLMIGFFSDIYTPILGAEDRAIAESMPVEEENGNNNEIKESPKVQQEQIGVDPNEWQPLEKLNKFSKGAPSSWWMSASPEAKNWIKATLQEFGMNPENVIFKLNNRADGIVRNKKIEELDKGDSYDLITAIKKGKEKFLELVEEVIPLVEE